MLCETRPCSNQDPSTTRQGLHQDYDREYLVVINIKGLQNKEYKNNERYAKEYFAVINIERL